MLDTNHKNSSCAFAEQMVSYIYGETAENEKIELETHLEICANCADELEGFGLIRSSLLEWREADFSVLETPVFEFPVNSNEQLFFTKPNNFISRFAEFWKKLTFNPAMAAAMGILIVAVAAIWISFNFSGKSPMAEVSADKNPAKISSAPTAEIAREDLNNKIADQKNESSLTDKTPETAAKIIRSSQNAPRDNQRVSRSPAINAAINAQKNNSVNPVQIVADNNSVKKTSPVKQKQSPNLTGMEEEEDNSIRLTDLFAEIDAK